MLLPNRVVVYLNQNNSTLRSSKQTYVLNFLPSFDDCNLPLKQLWFIKLVTPNHDIKRKKNNQISVNAKFNLLKSLKLIYIYICACSIRLIF